MDYLFCTLNRVRGSALVISCGLCRRGLSSRIGLECLRGHWRFIAGIAANMARSFTLIILIMIIGVTITNVLLIIIKISI